MTKTTKIALVLAILAQFFILTGMYIKAQIPLWTGEEIRVATIPVDPRSLFRGNYAYLNYSLSSISVDSEVEQANLRPDDKIYVSLKQNIDSLYVFDKATITPPSSGLYLRGRVKGAYGHSIDILYGIEAFFAPKKKALQLETDLRDGAVAVLMVTRFGQVALKAIEAK